MMMVPVRKRQGKIGGRANQKKNTSKKEEADDDSDNNEGMDANRKLSPKKILKELGKKSGLEAAE